jgi:hypothetical protein
MTGFYSIPSTGTTSVQKSLIKIINIERIKNKLCRWFRFAQLAKGKKFRP